MLNIQRHFCCYEDLTLWTEKDVSSDNYKENLRKLSRTLSSEATKDDSSFTYASCLFNSLTKIVTNCNLDTQDEIVSMDNFNLLIKIIHEAVNYGLCPYLPKYFVSKMRVIIPKSAEKETSTMTLDAQLNRLKESSLSLKTIFKCKRILACSGLEFVLLELLCCHFYLKSQGIAMLDEKETLSDIFQNRSLLFQHLMLLQGLPGVTKDISILQVHKALLEQLKTAGGFEIFSRLLMSKSKEDWHTYEIISKIVAAKGHTKNFYHEMIKQVIEFLHSCVGVKDLERFVPVCVTCLEKISSINPELNQQIQEKLCSLLETLVEPPQTLAGTVLLTESQLNESLLTLNVCFSKNSIVSLSSKMLISHYKTLFKLYCLMSDKEKLLLAPVLMNLFNNRSQEELKSVLKGILFDDDEQTKSPFDRLSLKNGQIIISAQEETPYIDVGASLSQFLIQSKNMLLVNDIFTIFLDILGTEITATKQTTGGDLLFEDDEIGDLLSSKFMKRLVLIEILQNLISCKQFQAHISGDPRKLLDFVQEMLRNEIKKSGNDEITMLLLTIFKELLHCVRNKDIEAEMMKFIKDVQRSTTNSDIINHATALFADSRETSNIESKYSEAISLLNQPEVYLKVYGIQQLIGLINQKDTEAIANKHVLLILALKNLKIEESYAYLNTIRLILALTNVMEAEVIDALLAEFENQELDVDFRMKIGETTVKIAEALGPITFKYKKELVNCFLRGAMNEKPELRASSLSNMGSLCRILTYQVTNFFQEILLIIHQTLQTDTILPARRSAVMILSDFLRGMVNLMDYQECLLPIYRTLKYVLNTENDEVTRIHAALSIETLNQKVKEMLIGELVQPEIEIRVQSVAEKKNIDVKYK